MAGYEPPSFSLGLDLGLDSEPQIAPDKHPTQTPAPHDEDFGPEVMDSDPESRPEPPRILKRLRRGPTATPTTKTPSSHAVDDDIEDFSSEDDFLKEMITAFDEDLWKDFCPTKSFGIPTPAFDEVFEEYFQSLKDQNVPQRPSYAGTSNNGSHHGNTTNSQNDEQIWDSDDPLPPAHHYFFHHDPRIQNLVRNRLPNFSPLGVVNNRKYQQPNASAIDYMRQFNNEEASKRQATQKLNVDKSRTRGRNKLKKSNTEDVMLASGGWMDPKQNATQKINVNRSTKGRSKSRKSHTKEVSQAPGSWVEPKSHASTPKDAGKRRVQANGESAGHWFTNSDGRKVYVTRGGQELTGQSAYRQYRKESGAGAFRKSRKRASTKKRKG